MSLRRTVFHVRLAAVTELPTPSASDRKNCNHERTFESVEALAGEKGVGDGVRAGARHVGHHGRRRVVRNPLVGYRVDVCRTRAGRSCGLAIRHFSGR